MFLAAARKERIAALDIADQEELFKDILVLTATEEIDSNMVLIDLIYEADVIFPDDRRDLFHRLSDWMIENGIGKHPSYLKQIKEDMEPNFYEWEGCKQLCMETPNVYKIVLAETGLTKEEAGPDDFILKLYINDIKEGEFTLNDLRRLKNFIYENEHLDSLAIDSYIEFIQEVEKRYK